MFAQRFELTLADNGTGKPVPKPWLDQFFMRNFTGYSAFDETLPIADGLVEASFAVDAAEVKAQLEKWLRGRKMISAATELTIHRRDAETQSAT